MFKKLLRAPKALYLLVKGTLGEILKMVSFNQEYVSRGFTHFETTDRDAVSYKDADL